MIKKIRGGNWGVYTSPVETGLNDPISELSHKILKGNLFKGHEVTIFNKPSSLCLHQKYFGGTVVQEYKKNEDKTFITYNIGSRPPKYIIRKLNMLYLCFYGTPPVKAWPDGLVFELSGNPTISLSTYQLYLQYYVEKDNISFQNHIDSINELNRLNEYIKKFKYLFKELHINDLYNLCGKNRIMTEGLDKRKIYVNKNFML